MEASQNIEYYQGIRIHSQADFQSMIAAGQLAASVLDFVAPYVKAGVSTGELDKLCHDFIIDHKAVPAPLNYKGFPKSICTSVNDTVCHGIPSYDQILKDGDIMNIDITVILDGWHGDTSRMFTIGAVSKMSACLLKVTYECMMAGIKTVKDGSCLGDIGHAISSHAKRYHYGVVDDFCGHGIGLTFHCEPSVLNVGKPGTGLQLKEGMFFTVEPMINIGSKNTKTLSDNWTVKTRDKTLSAQYEHTLGVTKTGYQIFTLSQAELKS